MQTILKTHALVCINIGSPASPSPASVRSYLTQFLTDPRIIDIPALSRHLLVRGIIAPTRSRRSAHAYQKVWLGNSANESSQSSGAPLIHFTEAFCRKLTQYLPAHVLCLPAMRYGTPSIPEAIQNIKALGIRHVTVAPMFPQYAAASTGSALASFLEHWSQSWDQDQLNLRTIPPFFAEAMYVDSWAQNYQKYAQNKPCDHIVFSFHGLPERQIRKSDPSASHCLNQQDCCANPSKEVLQRCYRAQCFASAHAIASRLGLRQEQYSVSFQSRLGRTPWIKPYTTELLQQLRDQGKKNVHVFCPAFVADCLETLEEVGIGLKADWQQQGGEDLLLIPSLNDETYWAENFANWLKKNDLLN